jgi:DNA-binding transcriptional ArsR family regulator
MCVSTNLNIGIRSFSHTLVTPMSELAQSDTIRDIQLNAGGKKSPKKVDFVHGEDRVRILHDPVRLLILQILRDGIGDTFTEESFDEETGVHLTKKKTVKRQILSVHEIIKISKESASYDTLTKNQIYHHLPLLVDGDFVVKHGTVTRGKRTTDYYRRTAGNFVTFGLHYDPEKYSPEIRKEIEEALPVFKLNLSKDEQKALTELVVHAEVMRLKWAEKIERLVVEDIADNKPIEMFERLLWIYATGKEEFLETLSEIRSLIFGDN